MPRTVPSLPIPPQELLGMQGNLPPYGSTLWDGDTIRILVARVPGKDLDFVNDVERIAEWASPAHVLDADACVLLTARTVHTVPMAPLRSHVEQRVAMDQRQAQLLRQQLPPGLSFKLYRAVDDPYRRIRLGVSFPEARMRLVDDDQLDELAVNMGAMLTGGLDDVHCVHLVAGEDQVRIAPDAFLADMLPRLQDDKRRAEAQLRLKARQQEDANARGAETAALRRHLVGDASTKVAPVKVKPDRDNLDWEATDDPYAHMHAQIDALGSKPEPEPTDAMSRLRQQLSAAGYQLRVQPNVPGHFIDVAGERAEDPQRVLAWSASIMTRDVAERALAATRDLKAGLGLIIAPEADKAGERVLVATRVRWITPDRIEGLRL